MMERCESIRELLVPYVYDQLDTDDHRQVSAHLSVCSSCEEETEAIAQIARTLKSAPPVDVPLSLRHHTLQLIEIENARQVRRTRKKAALGAGKIGIAVLVGLLQVLLFGLLSGIFMPNQAVPAMQMVAACIIWCGLIIAACLVVFGEFQWRGWDLGRVALIGLVAVAVAAFAPILTAPKPLYYAWETTELGRYVADALGSGTTIFLYGLVYGLVPMAGASFLLGRTIRSDVVKHAFLSIPVFVVLITPAVYLQSYTLFVHSSTMIASWLAGAAFGSFGGSLSGMGLHALRGGLPPCPS